MFFNRNKTDETVQPVSRNSIYAHMWANIAASNGYDKASLVREIVEKAMTVTDISKAQDLAHQCLTSNYQNCQ